jgi:hypothetical protein
MRMTTLVVLVKGLTVFGVGCLELTRVAARGFGPVLEPLARLEPVWPAVTLLACGACDLASFRGLRAGSRLAWSGGVLSTLLVLLFAALGSASGVPIHSGALGVAGVVALASLVVFESDYRQGRGQTSA